MENNKRTPEQRTRDAIAVTELIAEGLTLAAAAQKLNLTKDYASRHFFRLLRIARHHERLGESMPPLDGLNWKKFDPALLKEVARRSAIQLETGDAAVWAEPLILKGAV